MGVANDSFGRDGRADCCGGRLEICMALFRGLTFGDGGMARPSRGVRVPLLCRPPGIGGRSKGAGDDMLSGEEWDGGKVVLEGFARLVIYISIVDVNA